MIGAIAWNVRGLNRTLKQKELRDVFLANKISLCAILESHVRVEKLKRVCSSVFNGWSWNSNAIACVNGTRIIVGWDPGVMDVNTIHCFNQVIHCQVHLKSINKVFFLSIVYASNYYISRRSLWSALCAHKQVVGNNPWLLMGDFNTHLELAETTSGSATAMRGVDDFRECIHDIEMQDVRSTGLFYTWNQKPHGEGGILKKLDRIMCNQHLISMFPQVQANFLPYRISDHCPAMVSLTNVAGNQPRNFKFMN